VCRCKHPSPCTNPLGCEALRASNVPGTCKNAVKKYHGTTSFSWDSACGCGTCCLSEMLRRLGSLVIRMFRDATSRHDCFVELHAWRNGGVAQKTAYIKYNLYFSFSILPFGSRRGLSRWSSQPLLWHGARGRSALAVAKGLTRTHTYAQK